MRIVATLALALLLAGCNGTSPPPATTTSAPPATTTAPAATTSPAPATPPSGAPFDPHQYEEPAAPRADLIRAAPAGEWTLRVTGASGAVPGGASVLVEELGSSRGAAGRAAADGSFSLDVKGGEGAWVRVAVVPDGLPPGGNLIQRFTKAEHLKGSTYVRAEAATPTAPAGGRAVWTTGHVPFDGPWRFAGSVEDLGSEIRVRGTLRFETAPPGEYGVHARAARVFDEAGEPLPDLGQFATRHLTPSGFPLERLTRDDDPTLSAPIFCSGATCQIDVRVPMSGRPAGGWVVKLFVPVAGAEGANEETQPTDMGATNGRAFDLVSEGAPLTLLARGTTAPFRLATLLLADAPAQGERGVQAEGDRWGFASGILWNPALHVAPRTDAAGAPIRYLLEPYVPQVEITDRETPAQPYFPLALPGGNWSVEVVDPAGGTTKLGPAPFAQLSSRTATTRDGRPADNGGYNVDGVGRLDTGSDAFRHAFARDGLHAIRVKGDVRDADGNAFVLSGDFNVLVAEPLDLDLGMLPGTPLATGQYVDRAIQVHPPVPADIKYRFRLWSGSPPALALDETTKGQASAFGWFHPHAGQPIRPAKAGEYRVDVVANHTDASGRLWSASVSFGGVVVDPASALDVRGRRGIDMGFQRLERFQRSETGVPVGGNHLNFPYRGGDVAWQSDDDAMNVMVTLADPDGSLRALFTSHASGVSRLFSTGNDGPGGLEESFDPGHVAARFADGQGPLFSSGTLSGYYYAAVEKPGVRVRETVREDYYLRPYWRFEGDTYALQPGMGLAGDEPNDYKLMFAGAVVRDASSGLARTGAYASLWVDLPAGADSRVGSAFDPAAPPLFRFGAKDVRAFYDPTGTRAGSLLVEGDVADFGGYAAPLGPQRVFLNVTSPSGKVRSFAAQANPWGHVHDPALNFEADEPGVWRVDVHVRACPPAADAGWPCLDGGLNTGATSYVFYVASKDAAPLAVAAPAWLRARTPLDLGAAPGEGHATAWMPGWALDGRALAAGDPLVRHHPADLAAAFPNFEADGWQPGVPPEQVTLTALAKDASGAWRGYALDAWGGRLLPGG